MTGKETNQVVAETCVEAINERLLKQRSLPLTIPQAEVVRAVIEESLVAIQLAAVLR